MKDDQKRQRRNSRPGKSCRARPDAAKLRQGAKPVALEQLASAGDLSPRPKTLTPSQYEFCLNYVANGFNGSAAYKSAYPGVTDASARSESCRLLTNPNVKAFLAAQLSTIWTNLHMDAEEALARVANGARADVTLLFNRAGKMLAPADWPSELRQAIDGVEVLDDGRIRVKLVSKATMLRIILEQTGTLASPGAGLASLAKLLGGDEETCA